MKKNQSNGNAKRAGGHPAGAGSRGPVVTGHLVTHTHWDREWRVPIWYARARLIRMFDSVLDALEHNPNFKHFLMDGQVVGVEDYLEFRPERRQAMCKLIKEGRIQIGPWYNLPDEYPIAGEALIRNLLVGTRRAMNLGGCLKTAYLSFGWGQTAQFPQILAGFGIDFVFVGKNVSHERAPNSEFFWRAPDGTSLLATRLGEEGRANFYFSTIMPVMYGVAYHDPSCRVDWGRGGWLWRRAEPGFDLETTFERDLQYHPQHLRKSMEDALRTTADTLVKEHRFLGNGTDSTGPYESIERLIADANALDPACKVVHSGIVEYAAAIRKVLEQQGMDRLATVDGELRDGPSFKVSGNALPVRAQIKTLNRRAQLQLIRYAEPLAAVARMHGIPWPGAFVDKAWHYLLLAHSHDAINGVTLDKTARDTVYKLEQVLELAAVSTDMAASGLLRKIRPDGCGAGDVLVAVFNMSSQEARYMVRAQIDMPEEMNPQWVDVADANGALCPVQPLGSRHMASPVNVVNSRAMPFYCDRHELYFDTGSLPAMGYKVFKALPHGKLNRKAEFWNNVYDHGTQIVGPNCMANEHIEVAFNPNGTFDLLHKASGRRYNGLHFIEDGGDAGDYWQRVRPAKDSVMTTQSAGCRLSLVEDGPLVTSWLCEWSLQVPRQLRRAEGCRDDACCPMTVKSRVTLRAGAPYVEIQTTVVNQASDHRVRVAFPTCLAAGQSVAQGHFNVDTRPIERPRDAQGRRDDGMGTLPLQNFVDLCDQAGGLAVLNRNIMEYEVSDDSSRTVFLTMLRCVPVRICTEYRCATEDASQPGGQCHGTHTFEYALYPHNGDVWTGGVYEATEHYLMPPLACQFSLPAEGKKSLPAEASFLTIQPASLQLSAFKKAQDSDALIVRLYNPTAAVVEGRLTFAVSPSAVELVTLNEEKMNSLPVKNGSVRFAAEPFKILTFRCSL
ncbi:MAG: glycoside hydrolase family 38 C-terminal domain-containing protein [bacterium]